MDTLLVSALDAPWCIPTEVSRGVSITSAAPYLQRDLLSPQRFLVCVG